MATELTKPREQEQKATLKSLASLFEVVEKDEAIAGAMAMIGHSFDRPITQPLLEIYCECLQDLAPEKLALAFSRALKEAKFWPPPAVLRELSTAADDGSPVEAEAMAGFEQIIVLLKHHCDLSLTQGIWEAKIRCKRGPVLKEATRDEPEQRGPSVQPPQLSRETMRATKIFGWGDHVNGLRAIKQEHPAFGGYDLDQQGFVTRMAETVEKRWLECYKRAVRQLRDEGERAA